MQVYTETLDLSTREEHREVLFMPEEEEMQLLYRACSGDAEAKLQLVKNHLNLVVEIAAGRAAETGDPFPRMVRLGASAVIKAVDEFDQSRQVAFVDYVKNEVSRAIGSYYS